MKYKQPLKSDNGLRWKHLPHHNKPRLTMPTPSRSWRSAAAVYTDRRAVSLFLLGLAAGLPFLLIFSSLSIWLNEAGVERSTVTRFSWAALAYSFKFVWSPLADALPLPLLTRSLGRRRAWLFAAQCGIIAAICLMALIDPARPGALPQMALAAVLLGFSSATQDIVIDAYRIEIAPNDAAMQAVTAATYAAGYRCGMILSGASALLLAEHYGSTLQNYHYPAWRATYLIMAALMGIGIATTLLVREPSASRQNTASRPTADNLRLLLLFAASVAALITAYRILGGLPAAKGNLAAFVREILRLGGGMAAAVAVGMALVRLGLVPRELARQTWIEPVADFFRRYGRAALLLLALIGVYRSADIVAGVIANVFYQDLGYSKAEIARAVKIFGVVMTLGGGFLGGLLAQRYPLMRMMMAGALLTAATNLLFVLLAWFGDKSAWLALAPLAADPHWQILCPPLEAVAQTLAAAQSGKTWLLYGVVGFDNLAGGVAASVFIAFLSSLTSIRFTAVQYAIFSSLMTLLPKTLGGYSGSIVDAIGYPAFFTFTALLGVPVLALVYWTELRVYRGNSTR